MNPARMALRHLSARPWVSALSLASLSLAIALPLLIQQIRIRTETQLLAAGDGIDLVVGAKGSPLQLVLAGVHHLDQPTGNLPWTLLAHLRADPRVSAAIPFALGDNVGGFRIVGTDASFATWQPRNGGRPEQAWLAEGRWFSEAFEAVVGAQVAKDLSLRTGDRFVGSHGLVASPGSEHRDFPYVVTGILAPSGGVRDRLVFTPIESVWNVHEAEAAFHRPFETSATPRPASEPEMTLVWLRLHSPGLRLWVANEIREGTEAMAAIPAEELLRLYQRVLRPLERALLWMSVAVASVAAMAILATLLQAAERRRREWALLRVLGAQPREVLTVLWLEAVWLVGLGAALGWTLSRLALAAAITWHGDVALSRDGLWSVTGTELRLLAGAVLAGALVGLVPALLAYRRPPTQDLTPE